MKRVIQLILIYFLFIDFSFSKEYESYNSYNAAFNVPFGYIPDNNMSNPSYPTQFFNEQSFPAGIK